jgi:hypothetical protein
VESVGLSQGISVSGETAIDVSSIRLWLVLISLCVDGFVEHHDILKYVM